MFITRGAYYCHIEEQLALLQALQRQSLN